MPLIPNKEELEELKAHYRRGGLGDGTVKKRLESILKELIGPIRERRIELAKDPDYIMDILKTGTDKCRDITQATLDEVKSWPRRIPFLNIKIALKSSSDEGLFYLNYNCAKMMQISPHNLHSFNLI